MTFRRFNKYSVLLFVLLFTLTSCSASDGDYIALSYFDYVENDFYESGFDYNISPHVLIYSTDSGIWTESGT